MTALKPAGAATHTRNKNGQQVIVTREYGVVIVKTIHGKVLGSYEATEMGTFHKRYTKITAIKGR